MVTVSRLPAAQADLPSHKRYLNRELSWLDFNARVLALAADTQTPLLERVKFLAIFASNLDEFYMVRVAGLKRQEAAGLTSPSADGLLPGEQIALISEKAGPLSERHAAIFAEDVMNELARSGIKILRWHNLKEKQKREFDVLFEEKIFPILTPLAVDPGHPFPYISNRSLNLAVSVRDPADRRTHFARVKVPPLLPRFLTLSEDGCFVPLEDVIAANLQGLFPGMEILEHHTFRVTRDAELEVDDDGAEDLLRALEAELTRRRFSRAVRLEVEDAMPKQMLQLLMRELQVEAPDVFALPAPLDLSSLMELYPMDRPDLKDVPFQPVTNRALISADDSLVDIFSVLRSQDVLVHHPYESFTSSVQRFVEQAAADPDVLAIKQTLYRTSGQSPIVDALIEAAESGKQVVVLVEIKARFDEIANINWARTLERAGCHVVYGLVGLKTHSKLCMVVRREGDRLRRYVHIGTGNYNPTTARAYEDLGLLTSDETLGADIGALFNYLTGYSRQMNYRSLIVAPFEMRDRVIAMIEREASRSSEDNPGRIAFKLNHLVDEAVIDALYEASRARVQIDLLVRSICALRPGIPGLSDSIRVRSILGRFLEHSRIFYFRNGGETELLMGSADMMHRNLDRRVEALVRVESPELMQRLERVLHMAFADTASAWRLDEAGEWHPPEPAAGEAAISLQVGLMRDAIQNQRA
ncbi:MAG TPA: RNA degradosome polyphosphate kinase [Dehalococcoidia bacterium]|nr:RNA degradosome polyphosphate kinase [Dehalococcoidia bacterium]